MSRPLPRNLEGFQQEVADFEHWFCERQRAAGLDGNPLVQSEKAILMSYLRWRQEVDDADAQA